MTEKIYIKKTAVLLSFLIVVVFVVMYFRLYDLTSVRGIVSSSGRMAPFIFVILCIIRPIILLPTGLFSVLGGLLFGPFLGGVSALLGSTVGSVFAYYIAKYWGKDYLEYIFKNRFRTLDSHCKERGFLVTFLMRVIPILPCDVVSYVCGLSEIGLTDYILGTLIGIIPGTFIYSYFGSTLNNLYSRQFILAVLLLILVTIIPLLVKKFLDANPDKKMNIEFQNENKEIN